MTKKYLVSKFLLAIVALSAVVTFAATSPTVSQALKFARPDVKVQITGNVQREGKPVSIEKGEAVKPGEVIDWRIVSSNDGDGDAQRYSVVGQIPKGTTYIAGSAAGENSPLVQYSIDGGKSFTEQPVIDERQPDGTTKKVAAPVSMYTQVRFEWVPTLTAHSKFDAAYRVSVK